MMYKQRGLTAISWMVIIAFLAVQGIFAMRVIPVYLDYSAAKSVMDDMVTDNEIKGKGVKAIKKRLKKRLIINNLFDLAKSKEAFKFAKIKGGYKLTMHYEDRGPIYGNLEFLATFNYEVELPTK